MLILLLYLMTAGIESAAKANPPFFNYSVENMPNYWEQKY